MTNTSCPHTGDFAVMAKVLGVVTVNKKTLDRELNHMMEAQVFCRMCGQIFQFKGLPFSTSCKKPGMDVNSLTCRLPIEPAQVDAPKTKEIN